MIDEHAQALLALLRANPLLVAVLDGKVPTGQQPPYVLAYFYSDDPVSEAGMDGVVRRFVLHAILHSVGGNAAAARVVAGQVRTTLLGVTPAVPGRSCFPIRREDSQPPQRDESTGSLVMDQVDVYRLASLSA